MITVVLFFTVLAAESETAQPNPEASQASSLQGQRLTEQIDTLLHNPDPVSRRAAAWRLSEYQDPSVVMPFIQAFEDVDARVRRVAAHRFEEYPDPRAVEPLIKLFKDPEAQVRENALFAIACQRDPRVVPALLEVLQNTDGDCLSWCMAAGNLCELRDVRALEPFLVVFRDRRAPACVRNSAAWGLSALKDKRAVEALIAVLMDRTEPGGVRAMAASVLLDFDDQHAAQLIVDVVRADDCASLRYWAMIAAVNLTHGAIGDVHLLEAIADTYCTFDGFEPGVPERRKLLSQVVQNGKNEEVRVMAARLFLQLPADSETQQEKTVKSTSSEDPGTVVTQGDEALRAFRLSDANALLEKAKPLVPNEGDPDRRARLEAILVNDLAVLKDTQQRWGTASPDDIAAAQQGVLALKGKALIYFKGDPFIDHQARLSAARTVPVGTDTDVEAIRDGGDLSDADLTYLKLMPNLRIVDLDGSDHVTGAGLQSVRELKHLRKLWLPESITDNDLIWLHDLTTLEELRFCCCKITDEGLRQLTGLKNLESLHLGGEKITDQAMEHLKAFPRLSHLSLAGTSITDAGLKQLAQLKNLKTLNLAATQITDAGLAHLASLLQLEDL